MKRIIVFILIVMFAALVGCSKTPTEVQQSTPEPTSIPKYLLPFPATTPTPAPVATSTPVPKDTPVEQAYLLRLSIVLDEGGNAIGGLGTQSTAVGKNIMLLNDPTWRMKTVVYLASIKNFESNLKALKSPAKFRLMHSYYLKAGKHYGKCATLYAEGVDNLSASKINASNREMEAGTADLTKAIKLMPK